MLCFSRGAGRRKCAFFVDHRLIHPAARTGKAYGTLSFSILPLKVSRRSRTGNGAGKCGHVSRIVVVAFGFEQNMVELIEKNIPHAHGFAFKAGTPSLNCGVELCEVRESVFCQGSLQLVAQCWQLRSCIDNVSISHSE